MDGGFMQAGIPASSLREPGQFPVSTICRDANRTTYLCLRSSAAAQVTHISAYGSAFNRC